MRYPVSAAKIVKLEVNNSTVSTGWFPNYPLGAKTPLLLDHAYFDFDQQSEQLTGHDQTYVQLTPGPFSGRFFSGFLGPDVSIHLEYSNQALEQRIGGDPNALSFGVVLSEQIPFRTNGRHLSGTDVMILPPSGSLDVVSPIDGAIMAIVIAKNRLLAEPGLAPQVAEWLDHLHGDIGLLRAPRLAARLREDAAHALESAATVGINSDEAGTVLGNALIAGIAAKLSLEWALPDDMLEAASANSYGRFLQWRDALRNHVGESDSAIDLEKLTNRSKRSIEQAFSDQLSVGPLTYLRIQRLHNVRRALADKSCNSQSIGDIAASNGFWNWSRFSQAYKTHFGELPSEARKRLLA